MGCGCNKEIATPSKQYELSPIHQLEKYIETTPCSLKNKVTIFPKTVIQAVYDGFTGKRLDDVLTLSNHLYIPYKGCLRETYKQIPKGWRRKGLVVTTVDYNGNLITNQYINECNANCSNITDLDNWKPLEFSSKYFRPKNLRFNKDELLLDVVNEEGAIVDVLRTEIEGLLHIEVATSDLLKNPEKAKFNTIYLIPNESAVGTHREYVKYAYQENGVTKYKLEQLGSASGVCGSVAKQDRFLKEGILENGVLKLTTGVDTALDTEGKLNQTIEIPFTALSELKQQLETLKQELADVKNKQEIHVVSGRYLNDTDIELTLNNGDKVNIIKPTKPVVEEWKPATPVVKNLPALPPIYQEQKDPNKYTDEYSVISNGTVGTETQNREQLYRDGVPTGEYRNVGQPIIVASKPEVRAWGAKPINTETIEEQIEEIPKPDSMYINDPNMYEDEDSVLVSAGSKGSRKRTITKKYVKDVLRDTITSDWVIIKQATYDTYKRGIKKRETPTYKLYAGKYPHQNDAGIEGRPITEAELKLLTPTTVKTPEEVFKKYICVSNENSRFSYGFPKVLGRVSKIIDGSDDDIRENFNEDSVVVDGVEYWVYTQQAAFGSTRKRQEIPFTFVKQ